MGLKCQNGIGLVALFVLAGKIKQFLTDRRLFLRL
jgi:hypothetical protein